MTLHQAVRVKDDDRDDESMNAADYACMLLVGIAVVLLLAALVWLPDLWP